MEGGVAAEGGSERPDDQVQEFEGESEVEVPEEPREGARPAAAE